MKASAPSETQLPAAAVEAREVKDEPAALVEGAAAAGAVQPNDLAQMRWKVAATFHADAMQAEQPPPAPVEGAPAAMLVMHFPDGPRADGPSLDSLREALKSGRNRPRIAAAGGAWLWED